jgi:3'-5' exoribonuclease
VGRSKPPLVPLGDLEPGQLADFYALLAQKTAGTTREGDPFFTCRFRDARRTVTVMIWANTAWFDECARDWAEGQAFKIRGLYTEHARYGPRAEIQNIRLASDADRADGFDLADLTRQSRIPGEEMFEQLLGLVQTHVTDGPLCRLVLTILNQRAQLFKRLPATTRHAYSFVGGLLEHTLSVTQSCIALADQYQNRFPDLRPPLNKSLVVAGAVLHDIGRVVELTEETGALDRSIRGRLVGPVLLGRDLVRDTARELGEPTSDALDLLEHVLIAHLDLLEKGSPRQPMIPECLIVHHADALDSYLEMFVSALSRDRGTGPFTARDGILGRELYKGRTV